MLRKKFMIIETNLPGLKTGPKGDHFICTTQIGSKSLILSYPDKFKCTMFDGITVKIQQGLNYIKGEVHGDVNTPE